MYGLKKRSKKDESGLIQGAGTGTSDSIKKDVPAGSYIMPADSTAQLGAQNLKNLGSPTPVNVSNGEYQMSPEQVYQVGMQTLERMKDATHTPVPEQQGFGFKPGATRAQAQPQGEPPKLGFNAAALAKYQDNIKMGESGKPELFFAQGTNEYGVPALLKRREQNPMMNQGTKSTLDTGFSKAPRLGSPQTTQAEKYDPPSFSRSNLEEANTNINNELSQGNYARAAGQAVRHALTVPGAAAYDAVLKPVGGFMGGLFNTDSSASTSAPASSTPPPAATKQPDPTKAPDPAAQAAEKAKADAAAKAAASTTPPPSYFSTEQPQQQPTAQQNTPDPHAIIQNGNSFTDGATQASKWNVKPTNDPNSVANMLNNTREFGESRIDQDYNRKLTNFDVPDGAVVKGQSVQAATLSHDNAPTGQQQPTSNFNIQKGGDIPLMTQPANTMPAIGGFSVERARQAREQADLMARNELNMGMQGYGGIARQPQVPERTPEQEAQLQAEIKRVSTPIAGARGLTASQRNQINDLQQGYANRENDVYKTDANNAAALQREAMGQVGQNYRAELGEQGANSRFGANLGFEAQKFNATNDLANRQFSAEQLGKMPERMKQQYEVDLLQAYDKAQTDEERKPILEKLGALRGQTKQLSGDRFMSINGGQTMDKDGNITKAPDILIDKQTGSMHDYGAGQAQQLQPTQQMIEDLRKNPNLTNDFEHWFGKGSAAKYLG